MDATTFRSIYLGGIALNVIALGYAVTTGSYLYATVFVFAIAYLAIRLKMTVG